MKKKKKKKGECVPWNFWGPRILEGLEPQQNLAAQQILEDPCSAAAPLDFDPREEPGTLTFTVCATQWGDFDHGSKVIGF